MLSVRRRAGAVILVAPFSGKCWSVPRRRPPTGHGPTAFAHRTG